MPLHTFNSHSNELHKLDSVEIESSRKTLKEVILNNDLKFDAHIKSLCRKAALKLS